MSSDHPPPRRQRITLKPPARKPKAPDRPKVDELDRGFDHWFAQGRELKRQADAYYQELVRRLGPPPLPLPLAHHIDLQASQLDIEGVLPAASASSLARYDDLPHLVEIGRRVLQGMKPWAAAGEIAERIGGDARARKNNRRRLYDRFRTDAGIYRRIAQAPDTDAGIWEICCERMKIFNEASGVAATLRQFMEMNLSD
jgi:hypothetical protein